MPQRVSHNVTPEGWQPVALPAAQWVTTLMRCDNDLDVVFVENLSWII